MTTVDQFESVFRAAEKPVFRHQERRFGHILIASDLPQAEKAGFEQQIRGYLAAVGESAQWTHLAADDFQNAAELLELLQPLRVDLVVTYRNLHSQAWRWPFSLGECLDLLTQTTEHPVLVIPHPEAGRAAQHALQNTATVMAISGHLAGDDGLVNAAASFTQTGGTLWLTHVEDDAELKRTLEVIGKIPALDTEVAEQTILEQLLKEPHDYIQSCSAGLATAELNIEVQELVTTGHRLKEYRRLIEQHQVDLLVLNCKDADQLAMHGLAYPLAIELREIPLLML
jgi:hypothetical protein